MRNLAALSVHQTIITLTHAINLKYQNIWSQPWLGVKSGAWCFPPAGPQVQGQAQMVEGVKD